MLCEEKQIVPDLTKELKRKALQESHKIIGGAHTLLKHANPYGINGLVITEDRSGIKIYHCGDLMLHWSIHGLHRYICGDWTDILINEVKSAQNRLQKIRMENQVQQLINQDAAKNYLLCL